MGTKKKTTKTKSLSHGRPPTAKPIRTASISSRATRTLIRSHHNLEKQKAKALAEGDHVKVAALTKQIEAQGGIESYQKASLLGQANDRGGDSSRVLMEWLEPVSGKLRDMVTNGRPARLLEVGALSISNACSKSRLFDIERIDLNSQADGIKQQDFMERPLPHDGKEQFDVISLSLVLNYVPDAIGKGQMLLRTLKFLRRVGSPAGHSETFPCLFLVLPAPCVLNSRYMDESRMEAIMESLGYSMSEKKITNKLIYYLWRLSVDRQTATFFKKEELRSGKMRNNFAIVIK